MKIKPIIIPTINISAHTNKITASAIHYSKQDTISFKRSKNVNTPFINDTRELELHCAGCGKLMLKNSTVNEFINKKIYFPTHTALKRLSHEQNFQIKEQPQTMQKTYAFVAREAAQNPNLNIEELIKTPKLQDYIKKANKEQITAIEELKTRCKRVSHSSQYIVDEIDTLNPDFQKTEASIFRDLKILSKLYPAETIHNILNKPEIKEHYLVKLQKKQNSRLKKVTPLIQQLSPECAPKAEIALNESFRIFNTESMDIMHKRTRVIEKFQTAFNDIDNSNDKEIAKLIMRRLEKLPDSKNDVNAFMVKYSRKSENAIPKILIERLRNTNDHVKPEHRKGDAGQSSKKNYLNLCGKCNHERKTDSYSEIIQKNPQMLENTQRQIDEIIEYINKGILTEYDTWPNDIKMPLGLESEGQIVLDTSRLDIQKAKTERAKRIYEFTEAEKHRPQDDVIKAMYRRYGKKEQPSVTKL